jgi:hypothetical protein
MCERVQRELSEALDGDASPRLRQNATHLEACPECRDFRDLSIEFARRYRDEVEGGLRLLRQPEGALPFPGARGRPPATALRCAAAALLLVLGGGALGEPRKPLPSAAPAFFRGAVPDEALAEEERAEFPNVGSEVASLPLDLASEPRPVREAFDASEVPGAPDAWTALAGAWRFPVSLEDEAAAAAPRPEEWLPAVLAHAVPDSWWVLLEPL